MGAPENLLGDYKTNTALTLFVYSALLEAVSSCTAWHGSVVYQRTTMTIHTMYIQQCVKYNCPNAKNTHSHSILSITTKLPILALPSHLTIPLSTTHTGTHDHSWPNIHHPADSKVRLAARRNSLRTIALDLHSTPSIRTCICQVSVSVCLLVRLSADHARDKADKADNTINTYLPEEGMYLSSNNSKPQDLLQNPQSSPDQPPYDPHNTQHNPDNPHDKDGDGHKDHEI